MVITKDFLGGKYDRRDFSLQSGHFVTNKGYKPYTTSKYPDRKLAIVTCMDTRLIELLPAALGIKNGDAKIIKNAGGVIVHLSVVRYEVY